MKYNTCEEVLSALKEGKKVCCKHDSGNFRFTEGTIGDSNTKWIPIKYWYCNPQMNRTFAMLENGISVDSSIDILDFLYAGFIEYTGDEVSKPKKMTKEQIEKELGYCIEIIQ
jgi:hypothetical protein